MRERKRRNLARKQKMWGPMSGLGVGEDNVWKWGMRRTQWSGTVGTSTTVRGGSGVVPGVMRLRYSILEGAYQRGWTRMVGDVC
jgi:hypothetical protein